MRNSIDFTNGPIIRPLLGFTLPLFLGNILQQMYAVTDSIIVGRLLGPQLLAAIGASSPIIHLCLSVMIGFSLGVNIRVAQLFGTHEQNKMHICIVSSYIFFLSLAIVVTVFGIIFAPLILKTIETPSDVLHDAVLYLRISFAGTILMVGYNTTSAIYRGIGNSATPLFMLILSTVLNIALDFLFVIGFGWGIGGTAIATIISQGIAFTLAFLSLTRIYGHSILGKNKFHYDRTEVRQCMRIGIPSGLKSGTYWFGFVILTGLVNSYGVNAIAAFSTASKIDSFVMTPMASLSSSLSSFVGQNVGAKKPERIRKSVRASLLIGIFFATTVGVWLFFGAESAMRFFTNDSGVIAIGSRYLRIVSSLYIVYVLEEVPQGVAIGCGDTLWLLLSTVCAMWAARIPLSFYLSTHIGLDGIWYSMPSGWFVALLFCGGYYVSGFWKKRMQ